MNFSKNMKWSPSDYVEAAVVAREAGEEMVARLDWMTLKPAVILDVGCGAGETSVLLQKRYPEAAVLSLDLSEPMLQSARERKLQCICADSETLPFCNQSFNLIFANFLLPWHADIKKLLHEWRRILKPDGVLMLTALGPDTLQEWRDVLNKADVPVLMDMHDVGDALLQAGFADPVLDVSYYTTTYREQVRLIQELKASGMLAASTFIPDAKQMVPAINGSWQVTYEVIYAHAFAPLKQTEYSPSSDGTVHVPLSQLRKQLARSHGTST